MANSRRDFIKKSAIAVVAAGIPIELSTDVLARAGTRASSGFAIPEKSLNDPLMYLKQSSFAAYVNSDFIVRTNGASSELKLIKVGSLTQQARSAKTRKAGTTMVRDLNSEDSFSLLFRSKTDSIPQEYYNVDHSALGSFRLLLVPVINRDKDSYYYEAVINRSR